VEILASPIVTASDTATRLSTSPSVAAPQVPAKIVIVLGMHRSGTSCLTGSLQLAGLDLGEYSEWNPHNLKGNRENAEVMALNESILVANGGKWDVPPKKILWQAEHSQEARRILAKYAGSPAWGFKDPRTLLTLEGWLALGIEPDYIGIFRHPMAVASSLVQRSSDAMDMKRALALWYAYNKRLLHRYREKPFPLLCFDWSESEFHGALTKAMTRIGLQPGSDDGTFYTAELVHQLGKEARLPWLVGRLYKKLRSISEHYR
jgi:hypothetical protein